MYAVGPQVNYGNLVLINILAPALALVLVFLVPESPYHLMAKGKTERALETVRWLKLGASKDVVQAEADIVQVINRIHLNKSIVLTGLPKFKDLLTIVKSTLITNYKSLLTLMVNFLEMCVL